MNKFISFLTVLSLAVVCYIQHTVNVYDRKEILELKRAVSALELQNNHVKNNVDRYELEVAEAYELLNQKVEAILVVLGM